MLNTTARVATLVAVACACWPATARANDQQLVEEYLKGRGATGAVVRPITDESVSRTFPGFTFFGVIFRQYPVAVQCPLTRDLQCSNILHVRDGRVEVLTSLEELKHFFSAEMEAAAEESGAAAAAGAWLRFSGELKQDLFYTFSAPEISSVKREDATRVRGRMTVSAGGEGFIDVVMTLGAAGSLLNVSERSSMREGIRPICQATKLLDRDPIVRRMAEQDILVMGRAAKPYLDRIRASAKPKLQEAIDRIWQRIVQEGR